MVGLNDIGSFAISLVSSNRSYVYQYNWVVSIVATEIWKFSRCIIITLCSVSVATTLPVELIDTNVIVVTCSGNNNA